MKTCSACKYVNEDDAKLCKGCGIHLKSVPVSVKVDLPKNENIKYQETQKQKPQPPPTELDGEKIQIRTTRCPNCGKDTLPDFDVCTQCGKPLIPIAVQQYMDSHRKEEKGKPKENVVVKEKTNRPAQVSPSLPPPPQPKNQQEETWAIIICPVCGQKTRSNFGYCMNCKSDLKSTPEPKPKAEAEPIKTIIPEPQSSTSSEPVEVLKVKPPTIEEVAKEVATPPAPAASQVNRMRLIIPILIFIFFLSIMFLGVILFIYQKKNARLSAEKEKSTQVQSEGVISENQAIYEVFGTVRDAMLSKDTELLMSCYSPEFPDYQGKLNDTEELIKTYDITALTYSIDSHATKINGTNAEMPIKWQIKLRKYDDGSTLSVTDSNYVILTKENNLWKIKQVLQR